MPITLADYVAPADVRALLGVEADELSDATLGLPIYSLMLESELAGISADLMPNFAAAKAAQPPTPSQAALLRTTQLFATYSVAVAAAMSLPMFAFQLVTDGKATDKRFSDAAKDILDLLKELMARERSRVADALADIVALDDRVWRSYGGFVVAQPSSDPVTGT